MPGSAATERWRPELADLDLRPTGELLGLFVDGELAALQALRQRLDQLIPVVDALAERFAAGGRIVYAGAGTPGRLGLLDAAECGPTFGLEPGRITAVVAGGPQAIASAREDAEDHPEDGRSAVRALSLRPVDALIALSASGRTPFTLGAAGAAAAAGALTVAVVCDEG
ncbi:MAG: N-acetylmuramic acid 6-phosphate etherase, partial [Streptosporangiaceae bacterium]